MSFISFMEKFTDKKLRNVRGGMVCKIEKFDATKFRADVKPLMKFKNAYDIEKEYPVLSNLPVIVYKQGDYFIKPNYKKGDLVWVGFSAFDMYDPLMEYTRAESIKIHELHNACVLGTIVKENYVATSAMQMAGLVMGKGTGLPEAAIKGETFLLQLNIFLTVLGSVVGGDPVANAAAIAAINAAANVFKAQIELFKSQDVKLT